jgi:hypothetical protein
MTGCVPGRMPPPRTTQAAAITTWAYAAGFGVPTVPVAIYLLTHGRLPTFLGLFPMYGGPWSSRLKRGPFIALLGAFLLLTGTAACSAQSLWRGRKAGARINLALLPLEAVFWVGFALPLPWLTGLARIALLTAGWTSLEHGQLAASRNRADASGMAAASHAHAATATHPC